MNNAIFTVVSSTSTKNNNFCNKLTNKQVFEVQTEFGTVKQERSKTYYLFTDKQNAVGVSAPLDVSKFDVVTKPYDIKHEDGSIETITLDYLYPKRG